MEYKEYQSPSFFEAYINAFKNCLNFEDRSRRSEYWQFIGIFYFFVLVLWATNELLDSKWLSIKNLYNRDSKSKQNISYFPHPMLIKPFFQMKKECTSF